MAHGLKGTWTTRKTGTRHLEPKMTMSPRTTWTLLLTFAVSACSAGEPVDDPTAPAAPAANNCQDARGVSAACSGDTALGPIEEVDTASEASDLPREGLYDVGFEDVVHNDCGPLVDTIAPSAVWLQHVDADRFLWLDDAECVVWNDLSYTCDLIVSHRDVSPQAQLTIGTQTYGVVLDPLTMEEEQEVRIQCSGPGCDVYAEALDVTFPCEMVVQTAPSWSSRD